MTKKLEYVSCAYCGQSSILRRFLNATFDIDPLEYEIYTVREQRSGKGGTDKGFFKIEGKTIVHLANGSEQERAIARKIIDRIKAIYQAYEKADLIEG